jgi:lipid-A-disaccharide synthase
MEAGGVSVPIRAHDGGEGIAAAEVALSSSGTATLECAVLGTPVVVMYRLTRATYWLARRLVKVADFSLVNIIAGKRIVPELIQAEVNGERIAAEARRLLDRSENQRVRDELALVKARLGEAGAAERAARAVYNVVRGESAP